MTLACIVVMPVYNESASIAGVIAAWSQTLTPLFGEHYQILAINDGSTDTTPAILSNLTAQHPQLHILSQPNSGHGSAILHGYQQALHRHPEYIFQTDSDPHCTPADFHLIWNRRNESHHILGRRTGRRDAPHRRAITALASAFLRLRFGVVAPDSNIPFRLMHHTWLHSALPRIPKNVFAPNIFLTILAAHDGQKLLNIPITHHPRTGGSKLIPTRLLRAALLTVAQLLCFRP